MQEQIIETVRGLLDYNFPKNANGFPALYGDPDPSRQIEESYFGDTDITGFKPPAIVVKSGKFAAKDDTFGTELVEHTIAVEYWDQGETREESERLANEGGRLVREIMRAHKRLWVMAPCPFCSVGGNVFKAFTPEHFTAAHAAVMQPFVAAALADFADSYNATHLDAPIDPSGAAAMLAPSGVANEAFARLYESVRPLPSNSVAGLSDEAFATLKSYQANYVRPVRRLFDLSVSEGEVGSEKELLFKCAIALSCKEMVRYPSYGPDGASVPTDSFQVSAS